MKKILYIPLLFAAMMCAFVNNAGAEQIYGGDFLKTKYTVYDSAAAEENIGGCASFGEALPSKTEITFDFTIESDFNGAAAKINAKNSGGAEGVPVSLDFSADGNGFKLSCGDTVLADSLNFGRIYSLTVQVDITNEKFNILLYENHEKNRLVKYKSAVSAGSGFFGVTGATFEGDISVTYLAAARERIAANAPVTYFEDNAAVVSAELSEDIERGAYCDIYAAFYNKSDGTLAGVSKKTVRCFDNYAEAVFEVNDNFNNDSLSSSVFVFKSENMVPQAKVGDVSEETSDGISFNMYCTQRTSWYTLGDTVTYKPTAAGVSGNVSKICGAVYNSDGELTAVKEVSPEEAAGSGWTYTPLKSGYYKVVFYAVTDKGRRAYEYRTYNTIYDKYLGGVKLDKSGHNFYVTAFENKAWEQRNKLYGMSIDRYDGEYDMDIAKQTGMSFIRLHAFSWKDIQPTKDGELVWTKTTGANHYYERIFNRIKNGDKFDVTANILYTPLWASSNKDETENHYDLPEYATHAPSDNKYLTDFIDKLYEKYGSFITSWEIYNEPNVNNYSAFWHDTAENYVSMLKAAYNEIKTLSAADESKSVTDTVTMGGIGPRYMSFYKEFVSCGGLQYTDKLAMHGYDVNPWNYLEAQKLYGTSGRKGVVNTEAHMMLFSRQTDDFTYTEKQLALRTVKDFLRQIKYGVEKIAFFQAYDNHVMGEDIMKFDDLYCNNGNQWSIVMGGLYRKKPSFEPRFAAGAVNTLIAKSGSVTEYADEYKTGNVNIVKLTADGEPVYVMWCDELAAQSADAELSGITDGAVITDWEGREISPNGFNVGADEMYFAEGLGDDAFSYLSSGKGTKPYLGEALYSEYEKSARTVEGPEYTHSDGCFFDRQTSSVNFENAKWNKLYTYGDTTDLDGELAVYTSEEGLECVVRIDDNDAFGNAVDTEKAELLVGIDTTGGGVSGYTLQLTAKFTPQAAEGMRVYKSVLPYIGGDIADNTGLNENISDAKIYIFMSGGRKYFYMFVPSRELYPFDYGLADEISLGVQFRGYNSVKESTYCRVNENESYSTDKPWQFAHIKYAEGDTVRIRVNEVIEAEAGEYVSVEILRGDEVIYLNQYAADDDGKCRVTTVIEGAAEDTYTLVAHSRSVGYTTINLNTE